MFLLLLCSLVNENSAEAREYIGQLEIVILTGKEQCGDYLKVLILSDQLFPGKNLISLDAFKAVLSLFILTNKALTVNLSTGTCCLLHHLGSYQWPMKGSNRMKCLENSGTSNSLGLLSFQRQALKQLSMMWETGFLPAAWLIKS